MGVGLGKIGIQPERFEVGGAGGIEFAKSRKALPRLWCSAGRSGCKHGLLAMRQCFVRQADVNKHLAQVRPLSPMSAPVAPRGENASEPCRILRVRAT